MEKIKLSTIPTFSKPTVIILCFFLLYLCLGLSLVREYSTYGDDQISRSNGIISAIYVSQLFAPQLINPEIVQKYPSLYSYRDRVYGVFFDLPLAFAERILGFHPRDNRDSIFLMRHYANFLLFYLAVFFFFLLVQYHFNDWRMGLFGSIVLVLSPRIFAESFYNSKDIGFLSTFTISFYWLTRFLDRKTVLNAIALGVSAAAATNIRILGILLPAAAVRTCWGIIF